MMSSASAGGFSLLLWGWRQYIRHWGNKTDQLGEGRKCGPDQQTVGADIARCGRDLVPYIGSTLAAGALLVLEKRKAFLLVTGLITTVMIIFLWRRPLSPEQIASRTSKSVVVLRVTKGSEQVVGTGFALSDSLIATNFHVVRGASVIAVQLSGGQTLDGGRVVTYDARRDLALIAVPGLSLDPLTIADDKLVTQGLRIFVLGHPEGLEFSLSEGLVSSVRDLGDLQVIQMTAPISPGSSGGPVVDGRGRVVGVSTAFLREGQNLNFAVRSTYLQELLNVGRRGQPAIAAPRSGQGTWDPSASYSLVPGVYEVGYKYVGQESEFVLYVDDVGDSVVGRFGPSSDYSLPTGHFIGSRSDEHPLTIVIGDAGLRLEVEQVRSRELFSGSMVLESHGEVDSVPFTAVRKRPRLESDTVYVLVDEAGPRQPTGVFGIFGLHLAGKIFWRDAGVATVVGSFEPFTGYARVSPGFGTKLYGRVRSGDSVQFYSGQLTCQVPMARWPGVEGACWTSKAWYGLTQAGSTSGGVKRYAWQVLPPRFAGLVDASLTPDGAVQITLMTDSEPQRTSEQHRRAYRAWQATASEQWTYLRKVPWPSGLPGYRVRNRVYETGGLAFLNPDAFARWTGSRWDTVAAPRSLFQRAPVNSLHVETSRLSGERDLVLWSVGDCSFLSTSSTGHGSGCKTVAAVFEQGANKWTRLRAPSMLDSLPPGWKSVALGSPGAVFEFLRDNYHSEWVLATDTGVTPISNPVPDSGGLHPELLGEMAGESGEVYGVLNFCMRGDQDCYSRLNLRRALVEWSPGEGVRTLVSDSVGALYHAAVVATDQGRIVVITGDTVRYVKRWDSPLVKRSVDRVFGDVFAVLEDTLARRVYLVTSLGEVVSLEMPTTPSSKRGTRLARLWAGLKGLFRSDR